jgi:hypothetical protein
LNERLPRGHQYAFEGEGKGRIPYRFEQEKLRNDSTNVCKDPARSVEVEKPFEVSE